MKKPYLSLFTRITLFTLITLLTSLTTYAQLDPPANDDCAGAFWIVPDTVCTTGQFTTEFATQSMGAGIWCAGIPDDDVWFRFIATSQRMEIQANGFDTFDATIQRFNGNCGNLDPTPCADASGPGETETLLMEDLTVGSIYYFRVFDRLPQEFQTAFLFDLCLVKLPIIPLETTDFPCIAALQPNLVPVDGVARFYNNQFNTILDNEALITPPSGVCDDFDYSGWCSDDPIQNSAWFAFEAPASGSVAIDLCNGGLGTTFLTQLAVYSYTDCNDFSSFVFIAGNEVSPVCGLGSQLSACSLTPGETYLVMVDGYQAATGIFSGSITEIVEPIAGTGSDVDICKNTPAYDLMDALTGANTGGYWIDVDNTGEVNDGFFNAQNTPAGTYSFIYVIDGFLCYTNDSAFVTVSTPTLPDPGNNGSTGVCSNAAPFDLFDFLNGTPEAGGFWRDPNGAIHSGTYNAASDPEGDYKYIIAGDITCPGDSVWSMVTVEIITSVDAGGDGVTTTCTNDAPFNMFDFLTGTPDPGGMWFDESSNEVDAIFDPATQPGGNYFYIVSAPGCSDDFSILTITLLQGPDAGDDNTEMLCFNDDPVDLFTLLGGTPDGGGIWTNPANVVTGNMFDPASDPQGNYTYHVSSAGCSLDSAVVTILVEAEADAGENGSVSVCENNTGINLYDELGGTPESDGFWADPNDELFDGFFVAANDPPGIYTYFVVNDCSLADATVTVTVNALPDPGLDSEFTLCSDAPPIDLFLLLGGTPDAGGSWTAPDGAAHSGIFDAAADTEGAYWYHVGGDICEADSASVTITLLNLPFAGNPFAGTVTWNVNPTWIDLFTLLGSPDAGGSWSDDDGSGGLSGSIFTSTQTMNQNTYHFTYTVSNGCGSSSATVSVFVDQIDGIDEINANAFNIYPNPATRNLTIETASTINGTVTFHIYNIAGKEVYTESNDIFGNRFNLNLDLPPGKYILELIDSGTLLGRKKLIIQ